MTDHSSSPDDPTSAPSDDDKKAGQVADPGAPGDENAQPDQVAASGVPTEETAAPLAAGAGGDGAALEPAAEADLWIGRTHWKHFTGRFALLLIGNVAAAILLAKGASRWEWFTGLAAFWATLAIAVVSGLLVIGRVFLLIIGHRYRLTTQRLFIERGILSQTVDQTELIRVDDVRIHKSLADRLLGLGSVSIISTDSSDGQIVIPGIPEPEKVAEDVRTHMRRMRRKSLFVENL
jgi:membrane protein YdbS with pleckstrin-like domain